MQTILPTLYKMTNTGKIQEWQIECYKSGDHWTYSVTHGQMDGKKQVTSTQVYSGKNIGKANETTIEEQCKSEAEALWTKQQQRKGYSTSIPTSKPLLPMLAKSFDKDGKKIVFPCYAQPKLDGARLTASPEGRLASRTNKEVTSVPHIMDEVKKMSLKYTLDGELYTHNEEFQSLMSAIRKDNPTKESQKVQYWVYDIIVEDLSFEERYEYLKQNLVESDSIKLVPTKKIEKPEEVMPQLDKYLEDNYEGMMLRNVKGKYKINGRSADLQKVKKFQDMEFEIIDVVEGKGKFKGLGIIWLITEKGGRFKATPEGSEDVRRDYFVNKHKYIGQQGTVKFFEWTTPKNKDEAVPRFPIFKEVRTE
jgi:DNA ligase-1